MSKSDRFDSFSTVLLTGAYLLRFFGKVLWRAHQQINECVLQVLVNLSIYERYIILLQKRQNCFDGLVGRDRWHVKWGIRQIFDFFLFGGGSLGGKTWHIFFKTIYFLFLQKHTLQLVQSGGNGWWYVGNCPSGCSYICTFDTGISSTKKFYM